MHPEHYLAKQISNKNLYHRCDFIPLTDRIELSRWTMLGHVLRLPKTSPAALAFVYALDGCNAQACIYQAYSWPIAVLYQASSMPIAGQFQANRQSPDFPKLLRF